MKTTMIAVAALMAATTASAADFDVLGTTFTAGVDGDINYTTGVELWEVEVTPGLGVARWGMDFGVSTDINILELNTVGAEMFQGLDFTAGYDIPKTPLRAYGEVSTNSDLEFGDVKVGTTFSF